MPLALIPFLLLVVPILEIAVFIMVGSQIGVFPTLGMVVVTAIGGSILLRTQGLGLLSRMRNELDSGRVPGRDLVHGVMIMIAGVLLLTPGFVTDTLGFLLFVPAIRDAIWQFAKSRIKVVAVNSASGQGGPRRPGHSGQPYSGRGPTIDLDDGDYSADDKRSSPWNDG